MELSGTDNTSVNMNTETQTETSKKRGGFQSMPKELVREYARRGVKKAMENGRKYKFDREAAIKANQIKREKQAAGKVG